MSPDQPAARTKLPSRMTLFFIALAALSACGVWLQGGAAELRDALGHAGMLLLGIAPVIMVALLVGGYVQALLPGRIVARWLGENSGAAGYLIAMIAGAVTPAGPFGAFPLVIALRRAGAPFHVCMVYLTAWATLGIHRLVIWELPFLGPDFAVLRVLASLPLPIAAGLIARSLGLDDR